MSMPREAFEKFAGEYQLKLSKANQELMQIRAQLQARQRERKLTELTATELSSLPPTTVTYRTVGKMFLQEDITALTKELEQKIEVCGQEIKAMEKMALKVDQDAKDAERNLDSLIKKVQKEGLVQ